MPESLPQKPPKSQNFSGYTAEIIQHEIDHCNGVVV